MATAQHQVTNFNVDNAATYKAKIDGNSQVVAQIGAAFQCYANSPAAMNVKVAAGTLTSAAGVVSAQAIQTSGTITAPGANPRIDLVVLDPNTGAVSIVTGVEAASPVAPASPSGKSLLAQIALTVGMTTITNSIITDFRQLIQLAQKVSKRQCALTGVADSAGRAAFLSAGTGLTGTLLATTKSLALAFALGYSAIGDVDAVSLVAADMTNGFAALPASSTSYEFANYVNGSAVTLGSTLAPPQWGDVYDRTKQAVLQFGGAAGATTFLDDYGNTWTAQGGAKVQTNQFKFGTGGLGGGGALNVMNGTTDFLKCLGSTFPGNVAGGWTARAWCYPTTLPGVGAAAGVVSGVGSSSSSFYLGITNAGGSIKFTMNLSSNGTSNDIAANIQGTTTPAINTWYYIELTYDALAGIYRMYVNGVQEVTVTSALKTVASVSGIFVGTFTGGGSGNWQGYIDKPEFLPYCNHPAGTTYTVPSAAPSIVAAGYSSDFFSTLDAKMYALTGVSSSAGTDPTFAQVVRVYLGEQDTNATVVTASRSYNFRGKYAGSLVSGLPGISSTVSVNHNLGVRPDKAELVVECLSQEAGYVIGDQVRALGTYNGTYGLPIPVRVAQNTASFAMGTNFAFVTVPKAGGAFFVLTPASWGYRVNAERSF